MHNHFLFTLVRPRIPNCGRARLQAMKRRLSPALDWPTGPFFYLAAGVTWGGRLEGKRNSPWHRARTQRIGCPVSPCLPAQRSVLPSVTGFGFSHTRADPVTGVFLVLGTETGLGTGGLSGGLASWRGGSGLALASAGADADACGRGGCWAGPGPGPGRKERKRPALIGVYYSVVARPVALASATCLRVVRACGRQRHYFLSDARPPAGNRKRLISAARAFNSLRFGRTCRQIVLDPTSHANPILVFSFLCCRGL